MASSSSGCPGREPSHEQAVLAAAAVGALAAIALALSMGAAPRVAAGVVTAPWSLLLHVLTGAAALTAIAALWLRRYHLARVAAGAQVSFILWGWAFAQFPFVIPTTLTIRQAAAPRITLELLLTGLAGGAVILLPSLRYLFLAGEPLDEPTARWIAVSAPPPPPPPPVQILTSIVILPASATLAVGATQQFTATGTYSDRTTQNLTASVTWSSSDESVATISNAPGSNGLATGVNDRSPCARWRG